MGVNLWEVISRDPALVKGYSDRERLALEDCEFFHIRIFLGSGKWRLYHAFSYDDAKALCVRPARGIIYAGRRINGQPYYAGIPSRPDLSLLDALSRVGAPKTDTGEATADADDT